jgi:hypothetical protein
MAVRLKLIFPKIATVFMLLYLLSYSGFITKAHYLQDLISHWESVLTKSTSYVKISLLIETLFRML